MKKENTINNVIADDFEHGEHFTIQHFCVIEEGCKVGDNVTIGNYVYLKKGTIIGDNVFIDSYVKSSGGNRIGNNVTIRFNATIAREVTVEDGAFISPNVMTIYSNHKKERMGGTVIGEGAFIGTGAVLGPNVKIGRKTVIGAMSFVASDCDAGGTYVGIPANEVER